MQWWCVLTPTLLSWLNGVRVVVAPWGVHTLIKYTRTWHCLCLRTYGVNSKVDEIDVDGRIEIGVFHALKR